MLVRVVLAGEEFVCEGTVAVVTRRIGDLGGSRDRDLQCGEAGCGGNRSCVVG